MYTTRKAVGIPIAHTRALNTTLNAWSLSKKARVGSETLPPLGFRCSLVGRLDAPVSAEDGHGRGRRVGTLECLREGVELIVMFARRKG
jgi:hypothetical protein